MLGGEPKSTGVRYTCSQAAKQASLHGVPEWGSSRKISNGLDLTVVLSRFKNYRQVLELRSWEFSCVGFAFRRCGKFQNVERDRKNLKFDLVKGLKKTWLRPKLLGTLPNPLTRQFSRLRPLSICTVWSAVPFKWYRTAEIFWHKSRKVRESPGFSEIFTSENLWQRAKNLYSLDLRKYWVSW